MKNNKGVFTFILSRNSRILLPVLAVMTVIEAVFFNYLTVNIVFVAALSVRVNIVFVAALSVIMLYHAYRPDNGSRYFLARLSAGEGENFVYSCLADILCQMLVWLYQSVLLYLLIRYRQKPLADAAGWGFVFQDRAVFPFFAGGQLLTVVRNVVIIITAGVLDAVSEVSEQNETVGSFRYFSKFLCLAVIALYRCDVYRRITSAADLALLAAAVITAVIAVRVYRTLQQGKETEEHEEEISA